MLPWCLVGMSGMSVIVRPIQIRSEPRVSVRWPHPPLLPLAAIPPVGQQMAAFPSKPIGWTDAKHRRKFRFLLCLKTWAILWFRTHLDATAFLLDYISRQPRLYEFAHIWSAVFFFFISSSSNVTYAGIYHWRVHIYSMGHSNLLECKCAHVIIFLFFNDLYMWASFVTLNVFQYWLFDCFMGDGMFDLMHFAPMQESIASLRRWTRERILAWCFYNHFITQITLHVFLRFISRFACQTSLQPAGGDRNVVTFPPRSCEM